MSEETPTNLPSFQIPEKKRDGKNKTMDFNFVILNAVTKKH